MQKYSFEIQLQKYRRRYAEMHKCINTVAEIQLQKYSCRNTVAEIQKFRNAEIQLQSCRNIAAEIQAHNNAEMQKCRNTAAQIQLQKYGCRNTGA